LANTILQELIEFDYGPTTKLIQTKANKHDYLQSTELGDIIFLTISSLWRLFSDVSMTKFYLRLQITIEVWQNLRTCEGSKL